MSTTTALELLLAFLLGMFVLWLLELFVLRRGMTKRIKELEAQTKTDASDMQAAQEALSTARTDLKAKGAELETANQARTTAEQQLATLRSEQAKLQTDLDASRNAQAAASKQLADTRQSMANLQGEFDKTKAGNSNNLAEIAKLTAAAAATAAIVKGLESKQADAGQQVTRLQSDLAAAQQAKAASDDELAKLRSDHMNLQAEADQLTQDKSSMAEEISKLSAGALAAAALIKGLEGDKSSLTTTLDTERETRAQTEADLATYKLQANQLMSERDILSQDKLDLDAARQASENELATTSRQLADLQSEHSHLKNDYDGVLADVAKYSALAASTAAIVKALEGNQADLEAKLAETRAELETARAAERDAEERMRLSAPAAESAPIALPPPSAEPAAMLAAGAAAATLASADGDQADEHVVAHTAECPQDLADVKGIGTVYEQRLYDAGIGTYWQVYQLTDEKLMDIFEVNELQMARINFNEIRGAALNMARQTKSEGRSWTGGAADDFEPLEGIGATYEKRLYEAGICTYAALASTTVERLAEICQAPAFAKPDYGNWIEQARKLIAPQND